MSGSLPHTIALSNHTMADTTQPKYVPFDSRSDEDTNAASLNARNAKASSDHIVTISEQGQALSQQGHRNQNELKADKFLKDIEDLEKEFIEEHLQPINQSPPHEQKTDYDEKTTKGVSLDQFV